MAIEALLENSNTLAETEAKLDELRRGLSTVRSVLQTEVRKDTVPMDFWGLIRNYRYAVSGHRFELEVGGGVWLFVNVTSRWFDPFIELVAAGDESIDSDSAVTPSMLNGRLIRVRRRVGDNILVPVRPLERVGDDKTRDQYRRFMFKGARVARENGGYYEVTNVDRGDSYNIRVEEIFPNGNTGDARTLFAQEMVILGFADEN